MINANDVKVGDVLFFPNTTAGKIESATVVHVTPKKIQLSRMATGASGWNKQTIRKENYSGVPYVLINDETQAAMVLRENLRKLAEIRLKEYHNTLEMIGELEEKYKNIPMREE